ncbi:MAG: DNA primase [Lachnospiraceae bacterium]|nr:DNA primase [Lachnospiraceae bacterium]
MYSEEDIEEVRSRNDIVDVVSSYVQIKRSGSNYFGLCPFHNEKSPSFCVNPGKQMYFCFGCHKGGNVFTFLMDYNQCNFPEAVEELADRCGYKLPKKEMTKAQKERQTKRTKLSYIYKDAANYYYSRLHSNAGEPGRYYFKDVRGLDKETMRNFALGYAGGGWNNLYNFLKDKGYDDSMMKESGLVAFDEKKGPRDYFINRVIFPIVNEQGDPVGLGGRVLDDSKPKYLNSRENELFMKRKTIYGFNIAKRTRRDMYILCEGYMDVIALQKAGFDNAIAALGTALTKDHVSRLKRGGKKVYTCFDSDTAGIDATLRAIGMFKLLDVDCKVITMGDYKDPDEFIKANGTEAFEDRIKKAENAFIFAIDARKRDFDVSDPEENNRFFRNMAGRIAILKTDIERENYIAVLSERYNVSPDSLRELVRDVSKNDKELKKIQEEFYRGYSEEDFKNDGFSEEDENKKRLVGRESIQKKGKAGLRETEGILLTWLFEEPNIYPKIAKFINPLDFQEGLYRDVATDLVKAYEEGGDFDPASIMCRFEDNSAHEEIAKMLHTKIDGIESDKDKEVLLKETLIKLKKEGLSSVDNAQAGAGARIRQIKEDIRAIETQDLL